MIRICGEFIVSQQHFQVIAFTLDWPHSIIEFLSILFDSFVESIFHLTIKMDWNSIMIFKLFTRIFYLIFRFTDNLIKFLNPFSDNSEDWWWLDKENSILYLRLRVFSCIFVNFPAYQILCIWLDFLKVNLVLMIFFYLLSWSSFLNWHKNLSENIWHKIVELIKLFIWFVNHIIDYSHNFRSVISILFLLESCYFIFTNTTNEIEFDSSFVINRWNLWSQSYIWIFNFGLRILSTKKIKNTDSSIVDIFN